MNIVLIGMMGSGKSTVGKIAAGKLKWAFYDTDQAVEKEAKMSVADIFQKQGEAAFRAKEKGVIARLIQQNNSVIAAGGGAPLFEENWKAFSKNSTVIWLKAKPETLFARLSRGGARVRPLLEDGLSVEKIAEMLKEREPFYKKATVTIEVDHLKPEQAAENIVSLTAVR